MRHEICTRKLVRSILTTTTTEDAARTLRWTPMKTKNGLGNENGVALLGSIAINGALQRAMV